MAERGDLHIGQQVEYHSSFFVDREPQPGWVRRIGRTKVWVSRYKDPADDFRGNRFCIDTQRIDDSYGNSWFVIPEQPFNALEEVQS